MPAPSNAPNDERRASLGEHIRHTRSRLGYSVQTAAHLGDVGHMTWRRIERGETVQSKSYFAVDRVFGWDYGVTLRVAEDNAALDELPEPSDIDPHHGHTRETEPTDTTPAPPVESAAMSEEYRSVVRDVQNLNYRELQAVRRLVDVNADMFENMATEIRTALNDAHEMRPYLPRYGHETSTPVAQRYNTTYTTYSETWRHVTQLAHEAEPLIYHGRFADLQDLYARIVNHVDRLAQRRQDLFAVEEEAARDLDRQTPHQNTQPETEHR